MANRSPEIHHNDVMVALSHELGCDPGYLELVSWNLKSLMEDGKLGYGGDHFQLAGVVKVALGPQQAETTSFNKSTTRDFSFFVKALPGDNPEQRERLREGLQKESLFYTLLAQDLADALGSKELLYPSCVLAKGDCLIVQDLGAMRFRCCDSRLLDLEHTKLVSTHSSFNTFARELFDVNETNLNLCASFVRQVVRAMARQHAGSLILEERHGARLDQLFPELLRDSTNYSKEPGLANADWHRASFKVAVDIVPHLDKYRGNAELVARIQAQLPALLTQAFPGLQPWPDARNAVVHADLWTNNVMFRYDGVGSCGVLPVPVEVALVDFQLVRYTPPAHDLVTFLLYCTDKDFQERHFHELARLHWDCMAAELRGVALDPDKVGGCRWT